MATLAGLLASCSQSVLKFGLWLELFTQETTPKVGVPGNGRDPACGRVWA